MHDDDCFCIVGGGYTWVVVLVVIVCKCIQLYIVSVPTESVECVLCLRGLGTIVLMSNMVYHK